MTETAKTHPTIVHRCEGRIDVKVVERFKAEGQLGVGSGHIWNFFRVWNVNVTKRHPCDEILDEQDNIIIIIIIIIIIN